MTAIWNRITTLLLVPAVLMIGGVILSTACGGDDDTDSRDASPTAAATVAGNPSPAATEGSAAAGGTLTSANFTPAVTFEVGPGWTVVEDSPAAVVLEHVEGVPENQKAWIAVHKISDVRSPENFSEALPIPEDVTGWLAANRHLIVAKEATAVTLDGIAGSQIDIRTRLNFEPSLFGLVGRPTDDAYYINFLDATRFIELQDVEGGTIILAAGAVNQAYFEEVLPLVEPVIASVDFE